MSGSSPMPSAIQAAWHKLGDSREIKHITNHSPLVSTNRVYELALEDGESIFAKVTAYGSFYQFREDHERVQQWSNLLSDTPYKGLLARAIEKDGELFVFRDGYIWVIFYLAIEIKSAPPKILTEADVDSLAREIAQLHLVSEQRLTELPLTSKSLRSDIINLLEMLTVKDWAQRFQLSTERAELLEKQCLLFFKNIDALKYDTMTRLPVLVDWNSGNFSVEYGDSGFNFFSRWDYDWFRMEPAVMDLYFCSRVVRSEGDQTVFSYSADTFFEPRFRRFLDEYNKVRPLKDRDLLFLKEAYRFFILNYVIKDGEHFFEPHICRRLQNEALAQHLPKLEDYDFSLLLK